MIQLIFGISCLTLATYSYLYGLRPADAPRSLQAEIGLRLTATGVVFIYIVGFSDLIGIGTHITPEFERPFVGPLQLGGIGLGILSIILGFVLYHTSRGTRQASSMDFLVQDENPSSES